MDKTLYEHYRAILAAEQAEAEQLQAEKQQLEVRIEQVQASIARILAKLAAHKEPIVVSKPTNAYVPADELPSAVPERLKYAGMSVRWALLYLMADGGVDQLTSSQMADTLLKGGFRSDRAKNFNANVSAVVSEMVRKKGELEQANEAGAYRITDHGRDVWATIKHSRQFKFGRLAVLSAAATEPIQDDTNGTPDRRNVM